MKIYDYTVKKADGKEVSLRVYEGKVLLIVNTATGCGFTPQYEGLEKLYKKYKDRGFEILDFPCNQFLNQAPGTNEEIVNFCKTNYNTSFETFAKIEVNGENADPLYKFLKQEAPKDIDNGQMEGLRQKLKGKFSVEENEIQWNFTKFFIDRDGKVVGRFAPTVSPEDLETHIEKLL
ncbi:glutathione peroxidase [Defluviitalea raffinosedens]|uniref:glutathione peroxidase n=1 Tax=Defluviitalea raffinosedens TaxID=1450156 RepID=UPI00195EBB7A|nr:glutathione peroxidase [Defluviitalea raffinosedens]MBM7686576.1 glutathione peroxidase [Defluviitalea raffinosedens]